MMRQLTILQLVLSLLFSFLFGGRAYAEVNVVTTVPTLAALVKEVAGSDAKVRSLALPNQDPHFVDPRPSFVLALHRADLLVYIGLGLEIGWLPSLIAESRNADIQPGRPGHLDASRVCGEILGRPDGPVDRSRGDVHPGGNPHYLLNPYYALRVARAVADRLAHLDPDHASGYRHRFDAFSSRLKSRIQSWEKKMSPYRGRPIVGYHQSLVYFARWMRLREAGFIEPLPGISPSPRHLASLILRMRKNGVKVLVSEPWYDAETTRIVAQKTSSSIVRLPGGVGSEGTHDYIDYIDYIVSRFLHAFGEAYG